MSYTKNPTPLAGVAEALDQAVSQMHDLSDTAKQELLASGVTVTLETGDDVWVACVDQDFPETSDIELATVAIAGQNGSVRISPNGRPVSVAFWHGFAPALVVQYGINPGRAVLMKVALGEPLPAAAENMFSPEMIAMRSIRTQITVTDQLELPLTDVL